MAAASHSSIDQLKILLVGDNATGKHCYIKMLTQNKFPNDTRSNKECEIIKTNIQIDQDTEVPMKIFNISGSQRGRTKIKEYFKNIDGYIIMFDVTRGETFDNVIGWKKNIDDVNTPNKLPCILLANKCDLEKDQGLQGLMEVMDNYREAVGFSTYFEISVRDNINIQRSIQALTQEIIERKNSSTPAPLLPPPSPTKSMLQDGKPREFKLKILVIGEVGTGKTAFVQRYVSNTFSGIYRDTIGSDLAVKKIQYTKDIIVNLHFWDIAGGERFGNMMHLFYRDAAGCLIVFDVSRPSTLINGAVKWKEDFDRKVNFDADHQVPCVLIGNKCDLTKEGIVESDTIMEEFCTKHKFIRWYETSARENTNIIQPILFLIKEMLRNTDINLRETSSFTEPVDINRNTPNNNSTTCCQS